MKRANKEVDRYCHIKLGARWQTTKWKSTSDIEIGIGMSIFLHYKLEGFYGSLIPVSVNICLWSYHGYNVVDNEKIIFSVSKGFLNLAKEY